MKKITVLICLICVLLFSGCSCQAASILNFENNWNEGKPIGTISYEQAVYDVKLNKNFIFGDKYNFSSDISSLNYAFDYDFTGTATMVTEVLTLPAVFENSTSDIIDSSVNYVIHVTFNLDITASYKIDKETEFTDYENYVVAETYFVGNSSFTPIYSYYKSFSTIPLISKDSVTLKTSSTENKTFYNKTEYKLVDLLNEKEYSYKYSINTVIDNAQLLFCLRNINLDKKNSTKTIPTINWSYLTAQELGISFADDYAQNVTVKANGETNSADVISKCYAFSLINSAASCSCSNLNTGRSQLVFIQSASNTALLNNRAFMVKYVEPLTSYGNFEKLGALEYNLTEVNYN